jgi:tetratricopeptide (TPR) repeat protein
MTDRATFIRLIDSALLAKRADYARHVANDWLAIWPGDIPVRLRLAKAEVSLGDHSTALERLAHLVQVDPERIEAYTLLTTTLRTQGDTERALVFDACERVLDGRELDARRHPGWAMKLRAAYAELQRSDHQLAERLSQEALAGGGDLALVYIVAMKAHVAAGHKKAALNLARIGNQRWPECAQFMLLLADEFMQQGEIGRGVELLHKVASLDLSRELLTRVTLRGDYGKLWPVELKAELGRPIPGDVAAILGDNRIGDAGLVQAQPHKFSEDIWSIEEPVDPSPEPETPSATATNDNPMPSPEAWEAFRGPDPGLVDKPAHPKSQSETLLNIDKDLRRLAKKVKGRRRPLDEDGRVPAYIVLSSRTRMLQKAGKAAFEELDDRILRLVESVRRRPGWTAYRIYPDDPSTLEAFGIAPCDPGNAWQVKLRLADLDAALSRRGEMIGALFILGGNDIIPFHRLPNPTDDDDDEIPSDNPYAASDENYFLPEWPIGRLPIDQDMSLAAKHLEQAINYHAAIGRPANGLHHLKAWLWRYFHRVLGNGTKSFGYTASIWRKASLAVFKSIGDPRAMISSPPVEAGRLPSSAIQPIRLSYFNLHGLEDSPEWYGQRDPLRDEAVKIEFPIALRPEDVVNSGRAPKVVFTEACYGANLLGKTIDSSLSLKFLATGSRAFVGSTKVSYGSVTPPLIAADLLGRNFWQNLNMRLPVGESLRRAKLQLASEMHKRQGYLDGEDQKTLISFILFGDPLFRPGVEAIQIGEKTVVRRQSRPSSMKTACAKGGREIQQDQLNEAALKRIDFIVSQYLPGMQEASCSIRQQHVACDGKDHVCPTFAIGNKSPGAPNGDTVVVTLSKSIPDGERIHPHYARLTLDPSGKVMKLAVSR